MLELFKIKRKDLFKTPVYLMTVRGLYIKLYNSDAIVINIKSSTVKSRPLSNFKKSYLTVSNIVIGGIFIINKSKYKQALKLVKNEQKYL